MKKIDSKLPCVCSVINHRGRQNVVRTSVTQSTGIWNWNLTVAETTYGLGVF